MCGGDPAGLCASCFPVFDKQMEGSSVNLVNHTTLQKFVVVVKMSFPLFELLNDTFKSTPLLSFLDVQKILLTGSKTWVGHHYPTLPFLVSWCRLYSRLSGALPLS